LFQDGLCFDPKLLRRALDSERQVVANAPWRGSPARQEAGGARSYVKDTARSEERTVVATSNPSHKGVYNNWRPAAEMRLLLERRMRGASVGKTMYVVPYLMAPAGSPLERYAAGVQLTDSRTVALGRIVQRCRNSDNGSACNRQERLHSPSTALLVKFGQQSCEQNPDLVGGDDAAKRFC
jgi:GTP-dependent phosphoenolpyruvate carboxykinase